MAENTFELAAGEGVDLTGDVEEAKVTVTVKRNTVAYREDVANQTGEELGAGMVGYNSTLPYPPGTVGAALRTLGTGGGTGGGGDDDPYVPDDTPPPTPTGVEVSAGLDFIAVKHDVPTYTMGHGHKETVVYGVEWSPGDPLPDFGDAAELWRFQGTFGTYLVGPASSWRLWVTWITNDEVESLVPAGGLSGIDIATQPSPAVSLELLTGAINESYLFTDLSIPIRSIYPSQDEASTAALRNVLGLSSQATDQANWVLNEARDRGTALAEVRQVIKNETEQLAQRISLATAVLGDTAALVASVQSAYVAANAALASSLETLAVQLDGNVVALAEEKVARIDETGDLFAQYTIKTDINGYVAGYGLASTSSGASPLSEFGIRADRFFIVPPTNFTSESTPTATAVGQIWRKPSTGAVKAWNGSAWVTFTVPVLFAVQTTRQVINGVTIEPGVYMDGANIVNLSAMVANLGNTWITNAMVVSMAVSKLTAGSLQVGAYIQSTNYVPGETGWRISANGNAEFAAASIRGKLTTAQIEVGAASASFYGAIEMESSTSVALSASTFTFTKTLLTGAVTTGVPFLLLGTLNVYMGANFSDDPVSELTSIQLKVDSTVVRTYEFRRESNYPNVDGKSWAVFVIPIAVRATGIDAGTHNVRVTITGSFSSYRTSVGEVLIDSDIVVLENKV